MIEVKMVLTKLKCNDGLSEYCKNVFTIKFWNTNEVVFLSTFFTKKVIVFWFFFAIKKEQELCFSL
ncbi:hypothetical protein [Brachyspira aalborgi]|uniref:hypothetical protein n=1 Tax=Brachyspira aalborgi TaxID=29522 RepID=UPI00266D5634|nr:hypothetical protein [Brachyspira aalborgi]